MGRIEGEDRGHGIYMFWLFYNQMQEPNKHFAVNWTLEDQLATAVMTFG